MPTQNKPTAQQIAQGKARAGGNNPVKVTKAGVKRLGQAALIAASLTPAGRGVKAAVTATKAAKAVKTAKAVTKAKEAATTAKTASNSVKVTPPQKAAVRLEKNAAQESKVRTAKSGKWAESQAKNVDVSKGYMGAGLPKKAFTISDNVRVKVPTTPSGKQTLNRGTVQVLRENIRATSKTTKAEAKANARGLKAANKKK